MDAGAVSWLPVPDPTGKSQPTRMQVPGATPFGGAEGIWYDRDVVNFATKFDDKVWAYDVAAGRISVVYDWTTKPNPVLRGVDNIAVRNGDIFVCEDMGILGFPDDPEICVHRAERRRLRLRPCGRPPAERADRRRLQPGRRPPLLLVAAGGRRPRDHVRGDRSVPGLTACGADVPRAVRAIGPPRSAPHEPAGGPRPEPGRPAGAGLGAVGAARQAQAGPDAQPAQGLGLPPA